jgi:hypothetical protein
MSDFARKIIKTVSDTLEEGVCEPDEFVHGTFGLLAAAISKLPEAEREAELAAIEAGSLRRAVAKFPQRLGPAENPRSAQCIPALSRR